MHDIKFLEATLDKIVISRPAVCEQHPQNLCLDAGYTGGTQSIEVRQYIAHIRPRGEERKGIERNPDFKARRWVVEVTHSFSTVSASCSFALRKRRKTTLL